jgi:2-oxoglutarate dehydrogenase E1 component
MKYSKQTIQIQFLISKFLKNIFFFSFQGAPVFHVNGDDPESVIRSAEMAVKWRQHTGRDVVIDLICYRKHGHNEMDNPDFTQPLMYQAIKKHPSILTLYSQQLIKEGIITNEKLEEMKKTIFAFMEESFKKSDEYQFKESEWLSSKWNGFKGPLQQARIKNTGVSVDILKKVFFFLFLSFFNAIITYLLFFIPC